MKFVSKSVSFTESDYKMLCAAAKNLEWSFSQVVRAIFEHSRKQSKSRYERWARWKVLDELN